MTHAVLALGANVGQPRAALAGAVAALRAHDGIEVLAVSGLWRTAAVGGPAGQPDYLNAVVLVDTTLVPGEILALAHALESAAGRERTVRWGPRTLDVDVLAVDQLTQRDAELTLPHPRAHERRFVLAPWREVAPDWVLAPVNGEQPRRVADWEASQAAQDVTLVQAGQWWR